MKIRSEFALNLLLWCVRNIKVFLTRAPSDSLTIITASDFSHENSLKNLLISIRIFEPSARVVVYDLGMNPLSMTELKKEFSNFSFRRFPFEDYPSYYNIKVDAGAYAWKPAALEESKPLNGFVIWLDAGDVLTGRLIFLRKTLKIYGFFSPYSIGSIEDWTFPQTIKDFSVSNNLLKARNLGANVVAFDSKDSNAVKLIESWISASKNKSLIAPHGSSRSNHRQDQSLLTILAYQADMVKYGNLGEFPRRIFRILVHQDVD
jgi:hypothetical protein